jgi:hypothetical protein
MAAVMTAFTQVLFGEAWRGAIPMLQLLALLGIAWTINCCSIAGAAMDALLCWRHLAAGMPPELMLVTSIAVGVFIYIPDSRVSGLS